MSGVQEEEIMALLVTLSLSVVFFLGVMLSALIKESEKVEAVSIPLSFGAMLSVSLFDIIPEIAEGVREGEAALWQTLLFAFLGLLLLIALDKFVPEHDGSEKSREGNLVHIGIMATLMIAIHNIVEGMSVYSISSTSVSSGLLLGFGVALHNIPMGMLIYTTTKSEDRIKRAFIIAAASLSTFLGGLLMMILESVVSAFVVEVLTSITLGMVFYILFFELLPDMIKSTNKKTTVIWTVVGILAVLIGSFFE